MNKIIHLILGLIFLLFALGILENAAIFNSTLLTFLGWLTGIVGIIVLAWGANKFIPNSKEETEKENTNGKD